MLQSYTLNLIVLIVFLLLIFAPPAEKSVPRLWHF